MGCFLFRFQGTQLQMQGLVQVFGNHNLLILFYDSSDHNDDDDAKFMESLYLVMKRTVWLLKAYNCQPRCH